MTIRVLEWSVDRKNLDASDPCKEPQLMTMIFPGMDPYLENPAIFPGIHTRMVVYLADQIAPILRPRYIASVGERVYVEIIQTAEQAG
jgi:hypothetical protein